jgi:hypothetical protein
MKLSTTMRLVSNAAGGTYAAPRAEAEEECERREDDRSEVSATTARARRREPLSHVEETRRVEDEERAQQREDSGEKEADRGERRIF